MSCQHMSAADEAAREAEDSERRWQLLLRILDNPYIFRELGAYLDTEALACLYMLLPRRGRSNWFQRGHLASWGKRHDRPAGELRLSLVASSPLLDLPAYLSYRHLIEHARWGVSASRYTVMDADGLLEILYPDVLEADAVTVHYAYHTHLFRPHPMLHDSGFRLTVRACLFLPVSGPPACFAGNLVLLGVGGQLQFYAPTLAGYQRVLDTRLHASPHGLVCSPRGTALLAGHENTIFIALESDLVRCVYTGVSVHPRSYRGQCFTAEDTFLSVDPTGNVWEHTVERRRPEPSLMKKWKLRRPRGERRAVVTRQLLDYDPRHWPFLLPNTPAELVLTYKPATDSTCDCLLLSAMSRRAGLGATLRLRFAPYEDDGCNDACVFFWRSFVASVVAHPTHESVYVVVVTKLTREDFFSPAYAPQVATTEQPRGTPPHFDPSVTGVVAVYELRFPGGRLVRAVPRFYLHEAPPTSWPGDDGAQPIEPLPPSVRRAYRLYAKQSCTEDWTLQVQAHCGRTHLAIRLDGHTMAHLPLIASADNTVLCQHHTASFCAFAFSANHSFGAVFGRGTHSAHHAPLIACIKYNRFFPDVLADKIEGPLHAVTHEHVS